MIVSIPVKAISCVAVLVSSVPDTVPVPVVGLVIVQVVVSA